MNPQFSKSKTTIVLYKLSRETDLYSHLKLIRWFFRSLWHFVDVFSIISRWRLCWARVPVLHEIQESIHSEQYHGKDTKGLEKENHYSLLTIEVTRVTNISFLLTTSAESTRVKVMTINKWCFDLLSNSLNQFWRNVWWFTKYFPYIICIFFFPTLSCCFSSGITLKIIAFSLRLHVSVVVFIHKNENWQCFSRLLSRHFPPCFDHVL